jgi:hypothetical protein
MQPRKSKALEEEEEADDSAGAAETERPADTPEAAVNEDDEPDDLPSPGFQYEDPGAPPHQDSVDQPEVEAESESGPMQDNPQSTYGEPSNGIYHHSSGLTFPDSISPDITQQMWTSGAGADYSQTSVHGSTNNSLSLPQQMQETSNTLSFPEQRSTASASTSHAGVHNHQKSWGSYTTSQRSGAADVPTTTSSMSGSVGHSTTSWPAYSTSEATSTKHASASPRQSRRTAKPTSTPSYNSASVPDGTHQASALAQAAMNSAAARTASPVQTQYEAAAAISGAKSRQGVKAQTRTPVPSQPSRQPQRSAPAAAANTSYSAVSDKASAQNYNNSYSQYSTSADQSNNSVAYQPYSQQNAASATSSSYPSYDSYSSRTHNTNNTLPLNNSAAQNVASSYNSSTPSTASQWVDTSSQTRNTLSYTPNSSTTASPSLNLRSSNPQRSQIPPSFNVRPQAPSHTPSRAASTATYGQAQHNVPQNSYNSYSSQPQQQTTSTQQQQQGWYIGSSTSGYGTGSSRSAGGANPGYSSAGSGNSATHGAGQYGQQQHQQAHAPAHHAMNLSGHAYNSMDSGEQAIYNMLPGGSGH